MNISGSPVAALFVAAGSVYPSLAGVHAFDLERDALTFGGGMPVVAHPPCAQWSRLRHFARSDLALKGLAPWSVAVVRECGGVLEHPAGSSLWPELQLPQPGRFDQWGFSLAVDQSWFGHRCRKRTLLYGVGLRPADLPVMPFSLNRIACTVEQSGFPKSERHLTPYAFAVWLVDLARRCRPLDSAVLPLGRTSRDNRPIGCMEKTK